MNIKKILELHGFDENQIIKQIRIENGNRKYVIKFEDKYYLLSDSEKTEIDFVEKVQIRPEPKIEKKTKKNSKKKSKKRK